MDYLELLSWTCIILTLGMFSIGLPDLMKMLQTKSTDNAQYLPYLIIFVNNVGWLYYGLLRMDKTIIVVNAVGVVLQLVYMIVYMVYTKQKRLALTQTLVGSALIAVGWLYFTQIVTDPDARVNQMGLTCFVVTIIMYTSPLADLMHVLRTGNIQCWSFPLTVATFLTSTSWFLYGLQLHDNFIVIPNSPGIITGIIRFYLFWKYSPSNQESAPYKV